MNQIIHENTDVTNLFRTHRYRNLFMGTQVYVATYLRNHRCGKLFTVLTMVSDIRILINNLRHLCSHNNFRHPCFHK
jgi:hypothetical protein